MISVKSNAKDLQRILKKTPKALDGALGIALRRIGQEARSKAIQLAPTKSGDLVRSILMDPAYPRNRVTIGSNKVYARIQDMGGTITPKRGRYLTIPLGGTRGSIRGHSGGFFIKSKRGNLLYVKKAGSGIKPLFVLKRQVTLKGKPYLTRAFEIMKRGRAEQITGEEIDHVIKSLR